MCPSNQEFTARRVIHLQHLLGAQAALRLEAEGRAQVPVFGVGGFSAEKTGR